MKITQNTLCTVQSTKASTNQTNLLYKILCSQKKHVKYQISETSFPEEIIVKIKMFLYKNCLKLTQTVFLKVSPQQLKIFKNYVLFKNQDLPLQINLIADERRPSYLAQPILQQLKQAKKKPEEKCKQNYNLKLIKQWKKTNKQQTQSDTILKNHRHFNEFLKDLDIIFQSQFKNSSHEGKNTNKNHVNQKNNKICQIIHPNYQIIQRQLSLMLYYSQFKIINSQILQAMKSVMSNNILVFQLAQNKPHTLYHQKEHFIYFQNTQASVFANNKTSTKNSECFSSPNTKQIAQNKRINQMIQFSRKLNLKFNEISHCWKTDDNYKIFERRRNIQEQSGSLMTKDLMTFQFQGVKIVQTTEQ